MTILWPHLRRNKEIRVIKILILIIRFLIIRRDQFRPQMEIYMLILVIIIILISIEARARNLVFPWLVIVAQLTDIQLR
jgi:hypothetical protein